MIGKIGHVHAPRSASRATPPVAHGVPAPIKDAIKISAGADGFSPKAPTIPAGKEVTIVVDVSKAPACAKSLSIPGLGLKGKADDHGMVTLKIPAQKAGAKLGLQCSTAMIKGTITVGS